eukprot:296463_1
MASISRRMLFARIANCLKCFVICDSRNFYETFNTFQKYFVHIIIMSQFNRKYPLSIMDLSSILSKGLHGYGVNKDLLFNTNNGELQIPPAKYYSFRINIIKWN